MHPDWTASLRVAPQPNGAAIGSTAAVGAAPGVARVMAAELGRGDDGVEAEVRAFKELAEGYCPPG